MVMTFSFSAKDNQNNQLSALSGQLESFDVKTTVEYAREKTTHVVATKRNTPKGLQALINAKYIVDYSFVDALLGAARAEPDAESALEADFDMNWPRESDHLPLEVSERVADHPPSAYLPHRARQEIFDGYTFIFYNESQFKNLIAPITNGKGKALLYQADPSSTVANDFVRYVRNVAGEKGMGDFDNGDGGKGLVVVRYQPSKGTDLPFYSEFGRQVALQLDHRLIEQNEFLDAVLYNDASMLRRPLETESSDIALISMANGKTSLSLQYGEITMLIRTDNPRSNMSDTANFGEEQSPAIEPLVGAPKKAGRARRTVTSRFKGFDDEFDLADVQGPERTVVPTAEPQSLGSDLFVQDSQKSERAAESQEVIASTKKDEGRTDSASQQQRKRSLQQVEGSDEDDMLDQLAPAAANLKRQRLAGEGVMQRTEHSPASLPPPEKAPKAVNKPREVDILEVTRIQREKEDSTAKAELESLEQAMEGVDMAEVRNRAPIKEMAVKHSDTRDQVTNIEGNRWNDKWNGRTNFKKFRRKGQAGTSIAHKVIVPLQEVKKQDFGIGEEYWHESVQSDRRQDRQRKGGRVNDTFDNRALSQRRIDKGRDDATTDAEDDGSSHRRPRLPKSTSLTEGHSNQSPAPGAAQPLNKRGATGSMASTVPAKKAKHTTLGDDSEDSDEGLGFRFRKRK